MASVRWINGGSAGATLKFKASKNELRVGQLMPKMPVLVASDGRLLPQTFQGVQLQSKEFDNLMLIGGALDRARGRASTDLTGMAVSGGTQESDRVLRSMATISRRWVCPASRPR